MSVQTSNGSCGRVFCIDPLVKSAGNPGGDRLAHMLLRPNGGEDLPAVYKESREFWAIAPRLANGSSASCRATHTKRPASDVIKRTAMVALMYRPQRPIEVGLFMKITTS